MKNIKYYSAMILFVIVPYFVLAIIMGIFTGCVVRSNIGTLWQLLIIFVEISVVAFGTKWFVNKPLSNIENKFKKYFDVDN